MDDQNPLEKLRSLWQKWGWVLFAAALLAISCSSAVQRVRNVDFVCTNGDYQNYNVLRRFLEGQVPYRDFANYLGMGVLYLCSPLLALHNNLAGSMFATYFVAQLLFGLYAALVFYLVTGNRGIGLLAGALLPKLLTAKILFLIPYYGYYVDFYLGMLDKPNNSIRIVRMALPVLLCGVVLLVLRRQNAKQRECSLRALAKSEIFAGGGRTVGGAWHCLEQ